MINLILTSLFGLNGFWNRGKRKQITKMINKSLPNKYVIQKINWFTSSLIDYKTQTYTVYIEIKNDCIREVDRIHYWDQRDNGCFRFDLEINKHNIKWYGI